jgi:hypothetical protein
MSSGNGGCWVGASGAHPCILHTPRRHVGAVRKEGERRSPLHFRNRAMDPCQAENGVHRTIESRGAAEVRAMSPRRIRSPSESSDGPHAKRRMAFTERLSHAEPRRRGGKAGSAATICIREIEGWTPCPAREGPLQNVSPKLSVIPPRKRGSRASDGAPALDPRFRGGITERSWSLGSGRGRPTSSDPRKAGPHVQRGVR